MKPQMIILPANMLWSVLFLLLSCTIITSQTSVRLVSGINSCSGRVEILYNGIWGTVCDDFWDLSNAAVVCREMGCGNVIEAKSNAYFGEGSGQIWMDDVNCAGNEFSLMNCMTAGWGIHDCVHNEDAGVICELSGLAFSEKKKTQVMRLEFNIDSKTDLNNETTRMMILEKIREKIKDLGGFTLRWRTQTNQDVFQKEN